MQPKLVVYSLMPSRARYVFVDLTGERPKAIIGSDRYAAYGHLDPARRQICWAHLIRDFTRIAQRSGQAGRVGARLLGAAYVLFRWRERGKTPPAFEPLKRRVRQGLEQGIAQTQCRRTQNTVRIQPLAQSERLRRIQAPG